MLRSTYVKDAMHIVKNSGRNKRLKNWLIQCEKKEIKNKESNVEKDHLKKYQ